MSSARLPRRRLQDWLAGPEGLLSLPEAIDEQALADWLGEQGIDTVWIDLGAVADKAGLMAAMQAGLGLDAWFGANWDALADALYGPEDRDAPSRVLLFKLPADDAGLPAPDRAMLLEIIDEVAAAERSTLKGAILLVGEGGV